MTSPYELKKASEIALKEYLGLTPEETLLVVTDNSSIDVAHSLFEAGTELCTDAYLIEMKESPGHGVEPPELIAELMKSVDAVICPTAKSLTHTDAVRSASKLGVRVATMPSIQPETMIRCLREDYQKVIDHTIKLAGKLRNSQVIRVTTELGTDVQFVAKDRKIFQNTGVMRNIGESGNIPGGEVFLAPVEETLNGVIVFDGSFGGVGLLDEPIRIKFNDGFATRFTGKTNAKTLSKLLKDAGDAALAIGEFGIGTNHNAKVCGHILEDEKVFGTCHFAFGNNISMGGNIRVPLHIDGVLWLPTVYVDGKVIMQNGHLVD